MQTLPGNAAESAFYTTGPMSEACASCQTVLLSDSKVMVFNWVSPDRMSIELFDPETWRFSRLETIAANPGPVAELDDGRVLLLSHSRGSVDAWLIDPDRRSATRAGSGLERWTNGVSSILSLEDGRLLLHGTGRLATFDPSEGTFTQIGLVAGAHPIGLPNGSVFIPSSASAGTLFDPPTGALEPIGSPGPSGVLVAPIGDGRHLLVNPTSGQAALFDPSNLTFTSVEGGPSDAGSLIETGDRSVLVAPRIVESEDFDPYMGSAVGGQSEPWTIYDTAKGSFVTLDDGIAMSLFVRHPGRLPDGRLLFLTATPGQTAIYDPDARRFEPGPAIASARVPKAMQTLADGRVLLISDNGPLFSYSNPSFGSEIRRLFAERERSAELLVSGGSTRPGGCCPADVGLGSFVKIQNQLPISEEQAAMVAAGGLELVLTAPPGALEDAVEIAYTGGFWNSNLVPGAVPGGETPHSIVGVPGDCREGCRFPLSRLGAFGEPIPISGNPRLGLMSSWEEYVDTATVTVLIVYRSLLPPRTDEITLTITDISP